MGEPSQDITAARIYDRFRGLIAVGYLGSGERLPTVRQTAADLGVALSTAARAYRRLEAAGLVTTRIGSGTRVSDGASPLSTQTVDQLRALIASAQDENLSLDQITAALSAIWSVKAP